KFKISQQLTFFQANNNKEMDSNRPYNYSSKQTVVLNE
ncbi:MAG: hypothetical protein ACI83B_003913, partial [Sediminicola sp.]